MSRSSEVVWLSHRDPFDPRAGGAERTQLEVLSRLVDLGYRATVVASSYPGAPSAERRAGITYLRFPKSLLHLMALRRVADLGPGDSVIEDLAHVLPWPLVRLSPARQIVFFRHLHRRTLPGQVNAAAARALSWLEGTYAYIYAGRPTFVTESVRGKLDLEELGVAGNRISVVSPGVDSNLFRPRPRTLKPQLIYFSGLRAYKRPDHALRVVDALLQAGFDATLKVVGAGPSLEGLKESARSLGNRVVFTGRLSREDLAHAVAESWLHIVCSVAEGWGYANWEAASSGVPTVGYRVPGVQESVLEGVTGTLVPDGDFRSLADAATRLLDSSPTWRDRCRNAVAQKTWEATAEQWTSLLQSQ